MRSRRKIYCIHQTNKFTNRVNIAPVGLCLGVLKGITIDFRG
jgi:hypothetical protein